MSCYVGSGLEDANERESMVSYLTIENLQRDLQICHFLDIEKC